MLADESILKSIHISKWKAHTRGINVRSNIFTQLDALYRVTKKASTLLVGGSRYRRLPKSTKFPPASPARHIGIETVTPGYRSMRTYVGVFTNVISVIMGHPVSVQRRAGRPAAVVCTKMISVVRSRFSLDFARY